MSNQYSDVEIQEGLLGNDTQMIRYVFYEHFCAMLHFNAQKAAGNKPVAYEDLVQELYLYMSKNEWEKLRRYTPQLPFVKWFSVVSYRFFKDFSCSMIDSSQNTPISELNDHTLVMVESNRNDTMWMDIKDAIARLRPPRDKEVVEALVVNEEDPLEVAQRLNVTVGNLYNIKRRALAKLIQKHLKDYVK